VAVDGGYASKDNLDKAKESGIKDVAFHKKRGLRIEEMVKSTWMYRQLTSSYQRNSLNNQQIACCYLAIRIRDTSRQRGYVDDLHFSR